MTKRSYKNQNKNKPKRQTLMDNWSWGNGYMPRPGLDIPTQSASVYAYLQPIEAEEIYLHNTIAKNIVDLPAGDVVRAGWIIQSDKAHDKLMEDIMLRMRQLDIKRVMKQLFRFERLYGIGAVLIGTDETNRTATQPINPKSLGSIKYLTPFSRKKIGNVDYSHDVLDPNYGKVDFISVDGVQIDSSRLLIQQELMFEDDLWGRSIFESIAEEIGASKTTLNSVTQILYDYVFKVYKTPLAESMSMEDKLLIASVANAKFQTDGMAVLQADEELTHETKQVTGIDQLLDYLWERVSTAAKMPKSVIMGQESGTLTGAQYDLMNYYARISEIQETELRPHLNQIIRLLLWAKDEPGGSIDPDSFDWHVQFNPLYQLDTAVQAQTNWNQAQADQVYLQNGVFTAEEIHNARANQIGVVNNSTMTVDRADLDWEG